VKIKYLLQSNIPMTIMIMNIMNTSASKTNTDVHEEVAVYTSLASLQSLLEI